MIHRADIRGLCMGQVYIQGIYAQGVGHTVPIRGADDMKFFGFA